MLRSFLLLTIAALCASCGGSGLHSAREREMKLGIVQKKIREGMSQAEVVSTLGSPNIVTKDQNGNQTWVYDKVASEVSYSKNQGGFWLILGGYEKSTGASAKTQKTLTVVIKFNEQDFVDKVSYHSSKF